MQEGRLGGIQVSLSAKHFELKGGMVGFGGAEVANTALEAVSGALHGLWVAGSDGVAHCLQLRRIFFQKQLGHLLKQFTIATHTLQREGAIQHRNLIW
jgi:hypothetical protein